MSISGDGRGSGILKINNKTICATTAELNHLVARRWATLAAEAIRDHGAFHVALAGGSTPQQLYTTLAGADYARQIDWTCVHIYFGDERHVPPDHEDSNYAMAYHALLKHVPVATGHVHRIRCENSDARDVAGDYARELEASLPRNEQQQPVLDLVLLGLGPDGHIASLFPGTDILEQHDAPVAAVYVEKLSAWRVSLTYPVIDRARHIFILVTGSNKAAIVRDVFKGHKGPVYPVERLRPEGQLHWYLEQSAAGGIDEDYHDTNTGC